MKQKEISKKQIAQDFVNVFGIDEGILYSKDDYLYGYIAVRSNDDTLMSNAEFNLFTQKIYSAFQWEQKVFQIVSVPKTIDITGIINNLLKQKSKAQTIEKTALLNSEIEYIKQMVTNDDKEPLIYIKIWDKWVNDKSPVLFEERLKTWQSNLEQTNGIRAKIFSTAEIVNLCKIYSELNVYQSDIDELEENVKINKKSNGKGKNKNKNNDNVELLNMITPIGGITFKIAETIVGGSIGKCYSAIKFPTEIESNWLKEIMNRTDALTTVTFYPDIANQIAEGVSKNLTHSLTKVNTAKNLRDVKKYEKQIRDADEIFTEVDEKNMSIGHITIVTMPFTDKENELAETCRRIENLYRQQKIKIKCLGNLQKEAFKTLLPYYPPQEEIERISKRIFLLEALAGSGCMQIKNFKDETGFYFATTTEHTALILDMFVRGKDRTNSNVFFVGKSGTGKSTAIKSLLQILFMANVKLLILDPEREYKELVKNLGGMWINAGGGSSSINILEVRTVPKDDEDETDLLFDKDEVSALALHIRFLEMFFNVYKPNLTDMQKALLKKSLIEVYKNCGIVWDTDITTLKSEDYPIISDLYQYIQKKSVEDSLYKDLEILLYDIAEGADSFIWNKHTNIETNSQIICFDTKNLNDTSDNIRSSQYFNILSFCWDIMSKDKTTQVAIIADEAHLMAQIDTMKYMRNISKRCRKYEGMLGIITQNISDMLAPSIEEYSRDLIDTPTYKFIFGMDGTSLQKTVDLFRLSEKERDMLIKCEQRKAIGIIGNQKLAIHFDLPEYRLKLMGNGGGR